MIEQERATYEARMPEIARDIQTYSALLRILSLRIEVADMLGRDGWFHDWKDLTQRHDHIQEEIEAMLEAMGR